MPVSLIDENTALPAEYYISKDAVIWRYMDVAKHLSLLTTRKLWFTRIAEFRKTDPYEGAFTSRDETMIQEILAATSNDELINIFLKYGDNQSAWFIQQFPKPVAYHQMSFVATRTNIEHESYTNCVSCWHANSGESDAMWASYQGPGSLTRL